LKVTGAEGTPRELLPTGPAEKTLDETTVGFPTEVAFPDDAVMAWSLMCAYIYAFGWAVWIHALCDS
jgi:hypothetical protein